MANWPALIVIRRFILSRCRFPAGRCAENDETNCFSWRRWLVTSCSLSTLSTTFHQGEWQQSEQDPDLRARPGARSMLIKLSCCAALFLRRRPTVGTHQPSFFLCVTEGTEGDQRCGCTSEEEGRPVWTWSTAAAVAARRKALQLGLHLHSSLLTTAITAGGGKSKSAENWKREAAIVAGVHQPSIDWRTNEEKSELHLQSSFSAFYFCVVIKKKKKKRKKFTIFQWGHGCKFNRSLKILLFCCCYSPAHHSGSGLLTPVSKTNIWIKVQ